MEFDTKIKIAVREDLPVWQKLNVTAFLMSGIAGSQDVVGLPYKDRSGMQYLPMSRQPIMIHEADGAAMKELLKKSFDKDLVVAIYTEELFNTFHDEDNRAAVAAVTTEDLNLVGIAVRGKKNHVDKLFKGLQLHK